MKDKDGNTELALAIINFKPEDEIFQLMKQYPNDMKEKNIDGNYPLHLACKRFKLEKVIVHLLNAFP
jgi:ankyrin repeat protein